jgi:ribose transport system substrate-binding protein
MSRGTWLAGAFDLDPRSLQAVRDGQLLLVSPEHFLKGAVAGRLQAQHAADGKALPKGWIYTPGMAISRTNIEEISTRQQSPEAKAAWSAPQVSKILEGGPDHLRNLSDVG